LRQITEIFGTVASETAEIIFALEWERAAFGPPSLAPL
jgi:hypothetical protein